MNATTTWNYKAAWDRLDWLGQFYPTQQRKLEELADDVINKANLHSKDPWEMDAYQLALHYLEVNDWKLKTATLAWYEDWAHGNYNL